MFMCVLCVSSYFFACTCVHTMCIMFAMFIRMCACAGLCTYIYVCVCVLCVMCIGFSGNVECWSVIIRLWNVGRPRVVT